MTNILQHRNAQSLIKSQEVGTLRNDLPLTQVHALNWKSTTAFCTRTLANYNAQRLTTSELHVDLKSLKIDRKFMGATAD